MKFDSFSISMKDLCTRNVITMCNSLGLLYTLSLPTHLALPTTPPMVLVASTSIWHRRLRHPRLDTLSKLSNTYVVFCNKHTHELCHACQLEHHTQHAFC
jgi:hypothetical protein